MRREWGFSTDAPVHVNRKSFKRRESSRQDESWRLGNRKKGGGKGSRQKVHTESEHDGNDQYLAQEGTRVQGKGNGMRQNICFSKILPLGKKKKGEEQRAATNGCFGTTGDQRTRKVGR